MTERLAPPHSGSTLIGPPSGQPWDRQPLRARGAAVRAGTSILPFAIFITVAGLINTQRLAAPYARAFGAATASFLTLLVAVWMARRINRMERELQHLSLTDELTQLNNRRGFYFLAQQSFREAVRSDVGLMIFYFDLDGLKRTNDTVGHEAGSKLIQAFAAILLRTFRASDVAGRVGGDAFAVAAGGRSALSEPCKDLSRSQFAAKARESVVYDDARLMSSNIALLPRPGPERRASASEAMPPPQIVAASTDFGAVVQGLRPVLWAGLLFKSERVPCIRTALFSYSIVGRAYGKRPLR